MTILLLMVLSVLAVPPGTPTAAPVHADALPAATPWDAPRPLHLAPRCPFTAHVEVLGRACLADDGLFSVYDDNGDLLARTHGPDPAFDADPATSATHQYPERDPACAEKPAYRHYIHIIEAHAADDPYVDQTDHILSLTRKADHAFNRAAERDGRTRDLRLLCDKAGVPVITTLTLPTPRSEATFQTIVRDIEAQQHPDGPLDDPDVKYWVYYQDADACACAGIASTWPDDSAAVTNDHNGGDEPFFAIAFDSTSVRTWLHEIAHTMGAVQASAPNSSGATHCNDGQDIMCYADGGPTSDYTDKVCDGWDTFDCGEDDYFDTDPAPLSYLDLHWNLAHPRNRYIEGCERIEGRIEAAVPGPVTVDGLITGSKLVEIDPGCGGHHYVLEGPTRAKVDDRRVEQGNDLDVCWFQGGTLLGCDERIGFSSEGVVPEGADRARISAKAGAAMLYSLRIG